MVPGVDQGASASPSGARASHQARSGLDHSASPPRAEFTREDMVDAIATAISDSLDVDWNSHTGAEAVVRNCGVFELYEALQTAADVLESISAQWVLGEPLSEMLYAAHDDATEALAKVRGDQ
jgi:hypothetical protein